MSKTHSTWSNINYYSTMCCVRSKGIVIWKVVPIPTNDCTRIEPWCDSIILFETGRPNPEPFSFVVKKGSKMCSRTSLFIPAPLSLIIIDSTFSH